MEPARHSLVCDRVRAQISVGARRGAVPARTGHAVVASRALHGLPRVRGGRDGVHARLAGGPARVAEPARHRQPSRRFVMNRIQVGAAAALAVAALFGAGELLRGKTWRSARVRAVGKDADQFPTQRQEQREQAILERRTGRPSRPAPGPRPLVSRRKSSSLTRSTVRRERHRQNRLFCRYLVAAERFDRDAALAQAWRGSR